MKESGTNGNNLRMLLANTDPSQRLSESRNFIFFYYSGPKRCRFELLQPDSFKVKIWVGPVTRPAFKT